MVKKRSYILHNSLFSDRNTLRRKFYTVINDLGHKSFSSQVVNSKSTLDPYWIVGFTDAEGCFTVTIQKVKTLKLGWRVLAGFQITLHKREEALLRRIQEFFGVGEVVQNGNCFMFRVKSLNDISQVIIPFFEKYPLISQKRSDFELFR